MSLWLQSSESHLHTHKPLFCFVLSWEYRFGTKVPVFLTSLLPTFDSLFPLPALRTVAMSIFNSSLARQRRQSECSAWTEPKEPKILAIVFPGEVRFLRPGETELEMQKQRLNLNLPEYRAPATHESFPYECRPACKDTSVWFFHFCESMFLCILCVLLE